MRKNILIPLVFGVAGVIVLLGLGKWQIDRLERKQGILADITARIAADPVALPAAPDPERDRYLPVALTGRFDDEALRVLVSQKQVGAGYRIISPFETGERRIMVDRGFLSVQDALSAPPEGEVTVTGNLHWPQDRLGSTPENDVTGNTWFARDMEPMAAALNTETVLVIAKALSQPDGAVTPLPLDTSGIPNDHLSYAITWFSLAAIWAAMTGYYIWRNARVGKGGDR